ncbi:MAG TPA: hypothetical protein VMU76_00990 [Acidimicrobiales bacterium]|nr:hypothetical protein [Acidimicrobiales bacterium]
MALPSVVGGGGSFLDGYALSEEMGCSLVTSPFIDTVGVAGTLLASQDHGRFDDVLGRILDGTCIVSGMVGDRLGRVDRTDVRASRDGGGWRLEGVASAGRLRLERRVLRLRRPRHARRCPGIEPLSTSP